MLLLALIAGVFGAVTSSLTSPNAQDAELFAGAARQLTSSSGLDVFTNARLQVGPVYLAAIAPLVLLAALLDIDPVPVVSAAFSAAAAICVALLVRRLVGRAAPVAELGAGLAVVLGTPLHVIAMAGHFEELATMLLLIGAALSARADRPGQAAVLIGLSASCKLWGLLGVAVLLLDDAPLLNLRALLRRFIATAGAVAVVLATYLPFLALSRVATFEHSWMVGAPAPFSILAAGADFTFAMRLLQGTVAVAAGVLLARSGSTLRIDRVWTVPAAVGLTRLLVDPYIQNYYLSPVLVCLAIGVWSRAARGPAELKVAVAATAAAPLVLGAVLVASGPAGAWFCTFLLLAMTAVLWRFESVMLGVVRALRPEGGAVTRLDPRREPAEALALRS